MNDSREPPATSGATLGRRAGARLVDFASLAALGGAWGYPLRFGVPWLLGHALVVLLWFVVGDAAFGATLGKRIFGLRVESESGGPVGWVDAAKREVFVLFGAVPFVGPLIALVAWVLIARDARTPGGRGFHDRWGGTRVVAT